MQSIIFIDSEGESVQELAAIEVDINTLEIVDSYHAFAKSATDDTFARCYVHGLNPILLDDEGFTSENELISHFKTWLSKKPHVAIFGHAPQRERKLLKLNIIDMFLDKWIERKDQPSHKISKVFKDHMVSIAGKRCSHHAHSWYRSPPAKTNVQTYMAKLEHGFHCALYDAYELYLCYLC